MKKLFTTLTLCLGLGSAAFAQTSLYFNSAIFQSVNGPTTTITPHVGTTPGLSPMDSVLPCAQSGSFVSDTIYFKNFTTFSVATVNSLKIDSLYLPTGLTWRTTSPNNTFAGGQDGVILVEGTTNNAQGVYKLRIIVDVATNFINFTNADAESLANLRYHIRVTNAGCPCPRIDPADSASVYTPYTCTPTGPPTATISPAGRVNLCSGATQTLTASSGTGYTYKWSTGATTQAISVSAAASYVVTVYNSTDSAVSAPTVVTLVNAPTVTISAGGTDSICQGDSSVLTATPAGLNYAWSNTSATTQTIHTSAAGAYTVTATDVNHCTAVSNTISVVVKPLPLATITGSGTTLTAGTAASYQWYKGGSILTGETNQTLTVTSNGSYTVRVTNTAGCSATSAAFAVTHVGISDVSGNVAIRLYPNPSAGILTLETSSRTGDKYEIYDQLGRSVQQRAIAADKMIVDMSGQTPGMYTLTVKHGALTETVRFTIIK